jgi:2-haloacid dehalogenase
LHACWGLQAWPCSVYAFDAYGTLFDVHAAVRRHAAALGPDAAAFSALWRAKQLEYSWVRTLAGRYADFWTLTEQALDYSFASFPDVDPALRPKLLEAYRRLDCYPEVPELIRGLRAGQAAGNPVQRHAGHARGGGFRAGLDGCFDAVLSVEEIRAYKTDQRVYDLVTRISAFTPTRSPSSPPTAGTSPAPAYSGFRTVGSTAQERPTNTRHGALPPFCLLWKALLRSELSARRADPFFTTGGS